MPKASMYEDYLLARTKHKIGPAGQVGGMKPVSISHAVDNSTDREFGFRVCIAYKHHPLAAFFA